MIAAILLLLLGDVPFGPTLAPGSVMVERGQAPQQHDLLQRDLDDLERRVAQPRLGPDDVVADSQRLRARYRALRPVVPTFGSQDYRRHLALGQRSYAWLDRAGLRFRGHPSAVEALRDTYSSLGDFYYSGGIVSRPGAWFGYAGANRLGRLLVLTGHGEAMAERALEHLALQWAAVAYMTQSSLLPWLPPAPVQREMEAADGQDAVPDPAPLPRIDESALDVSDRARWREVSDRFPGVSGRVHQARVSLADLAARLRTGNLTLNARTVATALSMQGYLDDAVEAIEAGQFDRALEALSRADYERTKLRDATGQ
jgi:hypothetical protein